MTDSADWDAHIANEGLFTRRSVQYERLVDLLGASRSALELLNAVSQIDVESGAQQCEIVDALISSIERGQKWATGEAAVEVITCPSCEGTRFSRSGRGCQACRKTGRKQFPCRVCAEPGAKPSLCLACHGYRALDPVNDRELILRQHREWWERTTKMSEKKQDEPEVVHEGPPERPTARRGTFVIDDITVYWDYELGDDTSGDGSKERPFCTFHAARDAGLRSREAQTRSAVEVYFADREHGLERERAQSDVDAGLPPTSPMPRAIAVALYHAQEAIQSVPKNASNEFDDYAYTSAETIIAEARRALLGAGLAATIHGWKINRVDLELSACWMLIHKSGEQHVCEPVPMPIVLDGGRDKRALDKATATAITYCESQWLRVLLQIPRIGKAEDADARADGDGGRKRGRASKQEDADRSPLSIELNDAVLAMHEAIDNAKDIRAIAGVLARLEKATGLPPVVVERVKDAAKKRTEALLARAEPKP